MLFMIFRNRTRRPCVIVMAHYPGRADASTPFSKGVGAIRAIELARCLILDTIAAVSRARAPVFVAYHPPERKTEIAAWLGKRLRVIPQDGGDPGERKYTVLLRAFALGFTDALLVEGDVPDLPAGIVIECLDALGSGDAVVGPATGGGYYCIGFRREGPVFDALTDFPGARTRCWRTRWNGSTRAAAPCASLPRGAQWTASARWPQWCGEIPVKSFTPYATRQSASAT
jgi:glycosyltransferase A (GT-A) superfamily protein (DUF2064 family)